MKLLKKHSLFAKLLLIFTVLILAIIATYIISFKCLGERPFTKIFHRNVLNYSRYLVNDIGRPVTIERLRAVEKKTEVGIVFNNLKSNPKLPNISQLKTFFKENNEFYFARFERQKFVVYKENGDTFVFAVHLNFEHQFPTIPLTVATIISIIFLMLAYHIINRMFKPLESIKDGAAHFAKGDFSYQIPTSGGGQLGDLSRSISEMGLKIQSMLESKRELLLAIAHELRTPITRAKLHLELIEESEKKSKLNFELNEMSNLVTDLLESERLKEGHVTLELEETSLDEWIKSCTSIYKDQNIIHELEPVTIKIDRIRYSIALKNLLTNAFRYGKGNPITIFQTNEYISITNQGETIPKNEITKILDAFYRPDKSRVRTEDGGGVGLGLYLVKQITEAHGHSLSIQSSDGVTTFKISF